jgi:hypothetical protein
MHALASPLSRRGRSALRPGGPLRLGLWLPLTPFVVLLAPIVLVGSPLALVTRAGRRIAPWRAAWAMGAVLLSLSGLQIEVETAAVRIRIRIF